MGTPFISRADLSDYLGRDVSADDGALIAVDSACGMVRTLADQQLDAVVSDQVTLDGSGTDVLLLPELPVSAAGTVETLDSAGTATEVEDYALAEAGILVRTRGAYANGAGAAVWPAGRQNVRVTYDHGFSEVPEDLRMVALSAAARMIVQGVASEEQQGEQRIRYGVNATDFSDGERAIIAKYRRRRA